MPLVLKSVAPAQGLRWVREGLRLFLRHPLGFCSLFATFLFVVMLASLLPLVGPLLTLASLPLMSLGFMVAAEAAFAGTPIHPGAYLVALRRDRTRRRSQLILCLWYGALTIGLMLWCDWMDGGAFDKLQRALARGGSQEELDALLAEPSVSAAMMLRLAGAALISIPFWHAPALVHWGGQPPAQALFSSTVAVWRAKGAFALYLLGWCALIVGFGMLTAVILSALGLTQLGGMVALPGALTLSTMFYVSLIFTFNDSFDVRHTVVSA